MQHSRSLDHMHDCHALSLWLFLRRTGKYTLNAAQITSMRWRVIFKEGEVGFCIIQIFLFPFSPNICFVKIPGISLTRSGEGTKCQFEPPMVVLHLETQDKTKRQKTVVNLKRKRV